MVSLPSCIYSIFFIFNLFKLNPSFRNRVTVFCLYGWHHLLRRIRCFLLMEKLFVNRRRWFPAPVGTFWTFLPLLTFLPFSHHQIKCFIYVIKVYLFFSWKELDQMNSSNSFCSVCFTINVSQRSHIKWGVIYTSNLYLGGGGYWVLSSV